MLIQDAFGLSEEIVKKVLNEFGLTNREAEVYIFIAKHGVQKGGKISKQTKLPKALVYRILKSLEKKGVVESTLEFPARFAAVPFETVLEMNIRAKREEAALIEKRKSSLLEDWKNISKTGLEPELARFVVIEGTRKIYRKIAEMVEKTQRSLLAVSTTSDLVRVEQFGVFDSINAHFLKSKIKFHFLTDISKQNLKTIKTLKEKIDPRLNIKARNPDLGLALFPRMAIRDEREILLFISRPQRSKGKIDACIYTNCESLVQSFLRVFEDLWCNSTSIEEKIVEIETSRPTPKTLVIADEEAAKEKYLQTLRMAEEEIMVMTSSRDLVQLCENAPLFEELAKRDVSIKIMAPVTIENMTYAKQLSEYAEVRHVALTYLGTTIVDGRYLFQLKSSLSNQDGLGNVFSFKNAFYSTDSAHIDKIISMLKDIWKRAYQISKVTISPLLRSHIKNMQLLDTKRDLQKLPKRLVLAGRVHKQINSGIVGEIILKPPDHLNMPLLRISSLHFDHSKSKRGNDLLRIDLWLESPKGEEFVPVAVVSDAIPEVVNLSKAQFAGTPAENNHISVKHEELQVWSREKTLFAGWTIPIPLLDSKYVLDPACIIFEAFGDEMHSTISYQLPSGYLMGIEWDGFQAFTTYIGPSWKYSGPGLESTVGNFLLIVAKPETIDCKK